MPSSMRSGGQRFRDSFGSDDIPKTRVDEQQSLQDTVEDASRTLWGMQGKQGSPETGKPSPVDTMLLMSPRGQFKSMSEQHQDIFRDVFENSGASEEFISWPSSASFGDDDGSSKTNAKSFASWPEAPWETPGTRVDNFARTPDKGKNQEGYFASPSMTQTILTATPAGLHTPTFGAYGSFGVDTPVANCTLNDKFSPLCQAAQISKSLPLSPPDKICSPCYRTKPAASLMEIRCSPSADDESPSQSAVLSPKMGRPDGYLAASRFDSAYSGGAAGVRSISPKQLYSETPPAGPPPTAMKITLGQSTQSMFDDINCALKGQKPTKSINEPTRRESQYRSIFGQTSRYVPPPPFRQLPAPYRPIAPSLFQGRPSPINTTGRVTAQPRRNLPLSRAKKSSMVQTPKAPTKPEPSDLYSATFGQDQSNTSSLDNGKDNGGIQKKESEKQQSVTCNCKKSRCLKLYCDCFSAEQFCSGCKCDDCNNTPQHEDIREQAMKEVRAKNPQAFKPRIDTKSHNMGCRCKRSECLKKYCECFEARVLCNSKCKCSGCQNHAGSQKLIDKRCKMKDVLGAQFAMQVSDLKWKSQSKSEKLLQSSSVSLAPGYPKSMSGTALGHIPPFTGYSTPYGGYTLPYRTPHLNGRPPPYGIFPLTSSVSTVNHAMTVQSEAKRPTAKITPDTSNITKDTRKDLSVYEGSDLTSKRSASIEQSGKDTASANYKKAKLGSVFPVSFGASVPPPSNVTAAVVFQYLSRSERDKASLVCKQWHETINKTVDN